MWNAPISPRKIPHAKLYLNFPSVHDSEIVLGYLYLAGAWSSSCTAINCPTAEVFAQLFYMRKMLNYINKKLNTRFPLLRFRSALHCGYIVVSLIFKMAYFLSWPVQELLKKARVRCAIANSKIFAKTFNIFIRGRYLYQWYHYNHNAKRYENGIYSIKWFGGWWQNG
jgi:hypothetical protein